MKILQNGFQRFVRPALFLIFGLSLVSSAGAGLHSRPFDGGFGDLLTAPVSAAETDRSLQRPQAPSWPHEKSDLAPDPAVVFGQLPNGFRYVLMENRTPKDRVSMNLNVMSGSLNENHDQKGVAHFLEHMLFNGSTHFAPGELVKYFQSIGMQFGADANAYTGFDETVYMVLLPEGDEKNLSEGLLVIRDYADGASLSPFEIDRERKVILAEMRSRDSASYRTYVAGLGFEAPEARLSQRLPIGSAEVIRNADRNLLKDFYESWYRPDNMVLVMSGDFDARSAERLINDRFGDMSTRAPQREKPEFGTVNHTGIKPFYHFEKEAGNTTVSLEVIEKVPHRPDSAALQEQLLLEEVAGRMLQHRLDALVKKSDTPFTEVSSGSGRFLRQLKTAMISAEGNPQDWDKMLPLIEQTLRSALEFGFTQTELQRVKKSVLADYADAVKTSNTRDSRHLAMQIISSLNRDRVFQSPRQKKTLLGPLVEALTLDRVNVAFRDLWSPPHRLVMVTGNADLTTGKTPPENQLLAVYDGSRLTAVVPNGDAKPVRFPYLPDPSSKGHIVSRISHPDLGITQIDFTNGVRLNLKKTDFKNNEVLVNIAFGTGRSGEPQNLPGLSELGQAVVNESGLGSLSHDDIERAMAGRNTTVDFTVAEDHFALKGKTVPDEIRLLFQLMYAHLTDPAYSKEAYALSMQRFGQMYTALSRSIDGQMQLAGYRFLAGGDLRFGLPPLESFTALTLKDVRSWIDAALKNEPLEVSVVGDFDEAVVADVVGTYIGSLPARSGLSGEKRSCAIRFPASKSLDITVETEIPKALIVVAYPTEDMWDIKRSRRLGVLGEIFSDRLRERLRESLGATYSPYAYNRPWRAYPGYGVFQAAALVDPAQTTVVLSEVRQIISDLSKNGISRDELERALGPSLTGIKDRIRTNAYWLDTVLTGSKQFPQQIEWSRTIQTDYADITSRELSQLAAQYLDNEKAAAIVIKPV
jgi:zinc protease